MIKSVYVLIGLFVLLPRPLVADTSLAAPILLQDGTIATPYDICGAADQCASIDYRNGDEMLVYSEGASYTQPYRLHFTVLRGRTTTLVQYDALLNQPGQRVGTQRDFLGTFVLDHGKLRLDFYTNKDGTLKPKFTAGTATD